MNNKASRFFFAAVLLLCATFAHAQNIRWDLGAPGAAGAVTTAGTGGLQPLLAQPGVSLAWCNHPANAVPCTNFANTYPSISSASPCATNAQVTLQGSNTCVATGDNFGNLGAWVQANTACSGLTCYDYTLTVNGVSTGPYVWISGASSSSITGATTNGGLVQTGSTLGLLNCTANQIEQMNAVGTAWICANAGGITGSGTTNRVALWTGTSALGNAPISATASQISLGAGSNLIGSVGVVEQHGYTGSGATCTSGPFQILSVNCSGFKLLEQNNSSTSVGDMAGLFLQTVNSTVSATKMIGLLSVTTANFPVTDEFGAYINAYDNVSTTVTNRHGLYVLAANETPNTTTLNEAIVAQTDVQNGTTTTNDYTIHVLAPTGQGGLGTMINHVGLNIDTQGVGKAITTGTDPISFGGTVTAAAYQISGITGGPLMTGSANQFLQVFFIAPCNSPSCSATFAHAFSSTPQCTATGWGGSVDINTTTPPSTTGITLDSSGVTKVTVSCIGTY